MHQSSAQAHASAGDYVSAVAEYSRAIAGAAQTAPGDAPADAASLFLGRCV